MTQTQNYLGIKNGVVVCIQQLDQHDQDHQAEEYDHHADQHDQQGIDQA